MTLCSSPGLMEKCAVNDPGSAAPIRNQNLAGKGRICDPTRHLGGSCYELSKQQGRKTTRSMRSCESSGERRVWGAEQLTALRTKAWRELSQAPEEVDLIVLVVARRLEQLFLWRWLLIVLLLVGRIVSGVKGHERRASTATPNSTSESTAATPVNAVTHLSAFTRSAFVAILLSNTPMRRFTASPGAVSSR